MDASASEFEKSDRVLLQAEVAPRKQAEFESKYQAACGSRPCGQSYIRELPREPKGIRLQVWFNAPESSVGNLAMLGYKVAAFHKGEYRYMVESEELFWKLVRNGYKVGERVQAVPA
jgi:hypothetical protein